VADLIPPRRDESLSRDGVPTLRFSEYLERLASDVNDVVAEASESLFSEISTQNAKIAKLSLQINDLDFGDIDLLNSKISRLDSRVNDLEASDDNDVLNSRIAQVNAKVTRLIEELIAEIRAIAPDTELENKAFCIQNETLKQLKLLNLRTEEGLETELDEDDL